MIGLEEVISRRAITPELVKELKRSVEKVARYYTIMGHGSFATGNADNGLTTIQEKSMGAYCKSGNSSISGLIRMIIVTIVRYDMGSAKKSKV